MNTEALLSKYDPEVAAICGRELQRQKDRIEMIASENIVSEPVLCAAGSVLTNKYAEGYPGHRYYGGCDYVDEVEELARERAKKLFGAEHANVQPHSGVNANLAVYFALLKPGDEILGMSLADGGHLSHGSKANVSGKMYSVHSYGVRKDTEMIDYDEVRDCALKYRPKIIVAGASAYPRVLDFKAFREIADEVGAYLMVDIAHICGLVAAGEHPSPVPYADVVTTTTHKTLRGPRGGMILCRKELARKIDLGIFPGMQGGPLMHVVAAKAVALGEAMQDSFKDYQHQIVLNAQALSKGLMDRGVELVSGGTDNHLMLVKLLNKGISGKDLEVRLDDVHITANKNMIPFDPSTPDKTSGVRLGTPAATSRGFKEPQMAELAGYIADIMEDYEGNRARVLAGVERLCKEFPIYEEAGMQW